MPTRRHAHTDMHHRRSGRGRDRDRGRGRARRDKGEAVGWSGPDMEECQTDIYKYVISYGSLRYGLDSYQTRTIT